MSARVFGGHRRVWIVKTDVDDLDGRSISAADAGEVVSRRLRITHQVLRALDTGENQLLKDSTGEACGILRDLACGALDGEYVVTCYDVWTVLQVFHIHRVGVIADMHNIEFFFNAAEIAREEQEFIDVSEPLTHARAKECYPTQPLLRLQQRDYVSAPFQFAA